TLPRPSRRRRTALRRALHAHVGVLSGGVGDDVPRTSYDGFPAAVDQTAGDRADDSRLHRPRGGAVTRARRRPPAAVAAGRGGILPSPLLVLHRQDPLLPAIKK